MTNTSFCAHHNLARPKIGKKKGKKTTKTIYRNFSITTDSKHKMSDIIPNRTVILPQANEGAHSDEFSDYLFDFDWAWFGDVPENQEIMAINGHTLAINGR